MHFLQNVTKLDTTSQYIQNFTTLHTILHNSTEIYNLLQDFTITSQHCTTFFTKLYKALHNIATFYKTLQHCTQLHKNFTKLYTSLHNLTQICKIYKIWQNFTNVTKLYILDKHTKTTNFELILETHFFF